MWQSKAFNHKVVTLSSVLVLAGVHFRDVLVEEIGNRLLCLRPGAKRVNVFAAGFSEYFSLLFVRENFVKARVASNVALSVRMRVTAVAELKPYPILKEL